MFYSIKPLVLVPTGPSRTLLQLITEEGFKYPPLGGMQAAVYRTITIIGHYHCRHCGYPPWLGTDSQAIIIVLEAARMHR